MTYIRTYVRIRVKLHVFPHFVAGAFQIYDQENKSFSFLHGHACSHVYTSTKIAQVLR